MRVDKQQALVQLIEAGRYVATADGDIVSVRKNKVRSWHFHTNGYAHVSLTRSARCYVHQFVYIYFNGPFDPELELNHLNGVKTDNRPENLELVWHRENIMHAFANGLFQRNATNGRWAKV